jgi:hypothetical protein
MGRYLLVKNNIVDTIAKCDDTSSLTGEYTVFDQQNYPGVGINYIYKPDTSTFKLHQKYTNFINHSSASFDATDPNYQSDAIMGVYTSASYDETGSLVTPDSITSSSVSIEFLYPINPVASDAFKIYGASANNYSTVDNIVTFDLIPDVSLNPQGSINIILKKDKIVSTNGEIFPDNAPWSITKDYQSI